VAAVGLASAVGYDGGMSKSVIYTVAGILCIVAYWVAWDCVPIADTWLNRTLWKIPTLIPTVIGIWFFLAAWRSRRSKDS
jgi:hypothetical protein